MSCYKLLHLPEGKAQTWLLLSSVIHMKVLIYWQRLDQAVHGFILLHARPEPEAGIVPSVNVVPGLSYVR